MHSKTLSFRELTKKIGFLSLLLIVITTVFATSMNFSHESRFNLNGKPTPFTSAVSDIIINEFLPDPNTQYSNEWVELYNPTASPVDIAGCYIDDITSGGGSPYEIPAPNIIPAGGFAVFDFSSFLNNGGDDVNFIDTDGNTVLDSYTYTSSIDDTSIGREWDGAESWVTFGSPTKGTSNGDAPVFTVLISEVMYAGSGLEWIELTNNESVSIDLTDYSLYSYNHQSEITISSGSISPKGTFVVGELPTIVDFEDNMTLQDEGDVLELRNAESAVIDVVVWGHGNETFEVGPDSGWTSYQNATAGLNYNQSIFRYNISEQYLADTNSSEDWYVTNETTPNAFYTIGQGDLLISEAGIGMDNGWEFVEIFNNFTWPVLCSGIQVWTGTYDDDLTVDEVSVIPARDVIVVGDNALFNDTEPLFLTDDGTYVSLYDATGTTEIDTLVYGDGAEYGGTGWLGSTNVTGSLDNSTTVQRLRTSNGGLNDSDTYEDWIVASKTIWGLPDYTTPADPSSVLITEVMHDPSPATGAEYIEIYNTLDEEIDLSNWKVFRGSIWGGTAEIVLPLGTTLAASTHLTILDDESTCLGRYDIVGDYYADPDGFTLDNGPGQAILVDAYDNIIDRVAWDTSSSEFIEDIDPESWQGDAVWKGSTNKTIARLYDPLNPDNYIDTNASSDWRYSMFIAPGNHTNEVWFLSTPISDTATVTAFSSPDNSYSAIIDLIDSSEESIDMCVYQFTSYYILQHMLSAMDRGVKVRLLLEDIYPLHDSPYTWDSTHDAENYEVVYVASQINDHENGTVRWENDPYFRYTHAKYFIVDNEVVVISTENFKFTGIPKDSSAGNRGWGIAVNSTQIAENYMNVYNFDWSLGLTFNEGDLITGYKNDDVIEGSYTPISEYQTYENVAIDCQTVVGPDETIDVLVDLISSAQKSIYVEVFYMYPTWTGYQGGTNNNPFLQAILDAADRGVDVKVILDSTGYNLDGDNDNDEAGGILEQHGVEVKFSANEDGIEKFHVKALIVDNSSVMISSLNWNENSATNNREIGIIVNSTTVSQYYVDLFAADWGTFSNDELESPEDQPDDTGTYFWKIWLPIILAACIAILLVGYFIRHGIEKSKLERALDLTMINEASKEARKKLVSKDKDMEVQTYDLNFDDMRKLVYKTYGDKVKVAKVDPNGKRLDIVHPSEFVRLYIQNNHELIPLNTIQIPKPDVIVLKYGKDRYLTIDADIGLTHRLYEFKRILSTHTK